MGKFWWTMFHLKFLQNLIQDSEILDVLRKPKDIHSRWKSFVQILALDRKKKKKPIASMSFYCGSLEKNLHNYYLTYQKLYRFSVISQRKHWSLYFVFDQEWMTSLPKSCGRAWNKPTSPMQATSFLCSNRHHRMLKPIHHFALGKQSAITSIT